MHAAREKQDDHITRNKSRKATSHATNDGQHTHIKREHRLLLEGAKAKGKRIRKGKLRIAEAEALKRGLVARSCARSRRKDVVGKVKSIETMAVLGAIRGARERG